MSGFVENFADIIPNRVVLRGVAGMPIKGLVTIISRQKYPFKIIAAKAKNGNFIQYRVEEIIRSGRKGYVLTIENLKNEPGRYGDLIVLKTDSRLRPEIKIQVFGHIISKPG